MTIPPESDPLPDVPVPEEPTEYPHAEAPPPAPEVDARDRPGLRRMLGLVTVAVFVGVGFWLFGQRLAKDAVLRLELAPTLRDGRIALPREKVSRLSGTVRGEGDAVVATFDVPVPHGIEGPLSPPVSLHLLAGHYAISVVAEGPSGVRMVLEGGFDISGDGETHASVRGVRP